MYAAYNLLLSSYGCRTLQKNPTIYQNMYKIQQDG